MTQISASQFKARCLSLMDEVARSGTVLVITKNGKPWAALQ
jgi:prevent-host-death family protein